MPPPSTGQSTMLRGRRAAGATPMTDRAERTATRAARRTTTLLRIAWSLTPRVRRRPGRRAVANRRTAVLERVAPPPSPFAAAANAPLVAPLEGDVARISA